MPKRLESGIEEDACEAVRLRYGVIGLKLTPDGRAGFPDRIFLVPGGQPVLIEFKRSGEEPRALQDYYLGQLRQLGYDVHWTDSVEGAVEIVGRAVERAKQRAKL
jgi:hypothetical protein